MTLHYSYLRKNVHVLVHTYKLNGTVQYKARYTCSHKPVVHQQVAKLANGYNSFYLGSTNLCKE